MSEQSNDLKRLIALVQIEDVRLIEGFCQTSIGAEGVRPSELLMTPGVGLAGPLDAKRRFRIHAKMDARVNPRAADPPQQPVEPLMVFRVIHELTYSVPGDEAFAEPTLRAFASSNAVFNAWPYWRTFIQNCTAQMGLPRLIIPVFRGIPAAKASLPEGKELQGETEVATPKSSKPKQRGAVPTAPSKKK